jgi:hypothetical protein
LAPQFLIKNVIFVTQVIMNARDAPSHVLVWQTTTTRVFHRAADKPCFVDGSIGNTLWKRHGKLHWNFGRAAVCVHGRQVNWAVNGVRVSPGLERLKFLKRTLKYPPGMCCFFD